MTLTDLGTAWLGVWAVFVITGMTTRGWGLGVRGSSPPPHPIGQGAVVGAVWPGAAFEALVLVLVAALWFDSLGHGGWVILFLLLGALPAGDRWVRRRLAGAPAAGETGYFVASLLKYLLAGLVCVWRLT